MLSSADTPSGHKLVKMYLNFSAPPSWEPDQAAPLLGPTPGPGPTHSGQAATLQKVTPFVNSSVPGLRCRSGFPEVLIDSLALFQQSSLEPVRMCPTQVVGGKDLGLRSRRDLPSSHSC